MIGNWQDVDNALLVIGRLNRDITAEEILLNDGVENLKKEFVDKTEPLVKRIKKLEKDLGVYLKANARDLGVQKSRTLIYGEVGFRDSPPKIAFAKGEDERSVAKLLLKAGYKACVQVKLIVVKNAVKGLNLTEDKLARLGLRLNQKKNQFFYSINEQKVAEEN